mmetsp:Transcript_23164/g.38654  ORF Transcript_23164/g.38654 Transcript_23164/m.38654 type:complete len:505 (-) Transcript_23164:210-1724(-)
MLDARIRYLRLIGEKPLLYSTAATSVLCGVAILGLVLEAGKSCRTDLRVWIGVVIVRSGLRLLCRLHYEWYMGGEQHLLRGDVSMSAKCVDTLDVFGIVWFAVGNLLVFNNFGCVGVSPIVFFISLAYIVGSYTSFFLPPLLRCSLEIWKPTHPDDVEYMRLAAAERQQRRDDYETGLTMATLVRGGAAGGGGAAAAAGPDAAVDPTLTAERAQYWRDWLSEQGCYEVSYHPSMPLNNKTKAEKKVSSADNGATSNDTNTSSSNNTPHYSRVSAEDDHSGGAEKNGDNASASASASSNNSNNIFSGSVGQLEEENETRAPSQTIAGENYTAVQPGESALEQDQDQEEEEQFCSVCLLPFESRATATTNTANTALGQANSNSSGGGSSICVGGIDDIEAGSTTVTNANPPSSNNTNNNNESHAVEQPAVEGVVEDSNIIVRYPCHGHHYFHAHCLHSWLQVSGARYLQDLHRRHGRLAASRAAGDHRQHVTCPVCREHPINQLQQ